MILKIVGHMMHGPGSKCLASSYLGPGEGEGNHLRISRGELFIQDRLVMVASYDTAGGNLVKLSVSL